MSSKIANRLVFEHQYFNSMESYISTQSQAFHVRKDYKLQEIEKKSMKRTVKRLEKAIFRVHQICVVEIFLFLIFRFHFRLLLPSSSHLIFVIDSSVSLPADSR